MKMTDKQYLIELGKHIAQLREKRGWTQQELSTHSGVERSALGRMEIGGVNSGIVNLRKIAKALEISVGELVDL